LDIKKELKFSYILEGDLNLEGFSNLEKFSCSQHLLTSLDLTDCPKINSITCSLGVLTKIELPESANHTLQFLDLTSNNFGNQNLSMFLKLVNLQSLFIGQNDFFGSLFELKHLNKLLKLDVGDTNINKGLEFLPDSLEYFCCFAPESKKKQKLCRSILSLITNFKYEKEMNKDNSIKDFPEKLKEYKKNFRSSAELFLGNELEIYQKSESNLKRKNEELNEENSELKQQNNKLRKTEQENEGLIKELEDEVKNLNNELLESRKAEFHQLVGGIKENLDEKFHGYLEILISDDSAKKIIEIVKNALVKNIDEKKLNRLIFLKQEIKICEYQNQIEVSPSIDKL
jgi:hypothetical protein